MCVRIWWCSSMFIIWMKYELQWWDSVCYLCVFEDLGYRYIYWYKYTPLCQIVCQCYTSSNIPQSLLISQTRNILIHMNYNNTILPKDGTYHINIYIYNRGCHVRWVAYMIPLFYHGNNDMFVIYLQCNSIMS